MKYKATSDARFALKAVFQRGLQDAGRGGADYLAKGTATDVAIN